MISVSQVGDLIWKEEGFIPHVYDDQKGFQTLGPGILVDRRRGGGISPTEGRFLMENRIRLAEEECIRRFTWWWKLNEVRQQVIVCMVYQMGGATVSGFKKMAAAIQNEDWEAAANEMLDSEWHRKDSPARARRMAKIMRTGEWPDEFLSK